MSKLFDKLSSAWQGPPMLVKVGKQEYLLGNSPPEATITIKKKAIIPRLLRSPSLAFGEGYMDGDIVIDGDILTILRGFHQTSWQAGPMIGLMQMLAGRRPTSIQRAKSNAQAHYDIGNDFYQLWLDPTRTYSCAYFEKGDETLVEAQQQKLDLICRKLRLEPGQALLDIGAGWGSLVLHAAQHYDVTATAITPATEQAAYIAEQAVAHGLSDRIQIIQDDWRSLTGQYDRLVSVGMFEHVGVRQHRAFLRTWQQLLDPAGVSLLHTICHRHPATPDPWITKYIFPGGYLPTIPEVTDAVSSTNLWLYRLENLKPHYAKTLHHWSANFLAQRDAVVKMFDERFARMWELYLWGSEAGFLWGDLELIQLEIYGPAATLPLSRAIK